jgi:hypothetical protein
VRVLGLHGGERRSDGGLHDSGSNHSRRGGCEEEGDDGRSVLGVVSRRSRLLLHQLWETQRTVEGHWQRLLRQRIVFP